MTDPGLLYRQNVTQLAQEWALRWVNFPPKGF